MGDTIELRDHSQPCEHSGVLGAHIRPPRSGIWHCLTDNCPGGKKVLAHDYGYTWPQDDGSEWPLYGLEMKEH